MKLDIREMAAAKSVSAWIILNRRGEYVATVRAHHGSRATVNIWQEDAAAQRSMAAAEKAGDKIPPAPSKYIGPFDYQAARGNSDIESALHGMYVDGYRLCGHCGESLKKPKAGFFPRDFKAPAGFHLANYGQYVDGKRWHSYDWEELAREELGESVDWETMKSRARELESAAETVGGYSDCYKSAGLRYLEELGYQIFKAI